MITLRALLLMLCLSAASWIATAAGMNTSATGGPEHQVLVMLHLPAPHFRPDANYAGRYGDDAGRSARHRIAEELARTHGLKLVSDWPMPTLGVDCYVMEDASNTPPERIAERLAQDPRVEWAQPMSTFHTLGRSDPLYPVQPDAKFWHIAEIHRVATGRNVRVAVVDSGIETEHPDLAGQIAFKENFVDNNPYKPEMHGTEVAGIIAARTGNGVGIEGVAPDVRLMALRACWQDASGSSLCNSFTLGKAINFAITHDAQVINLSLTGPPDRLLKSLLDAALTRGIKVIGAVDSQTRGGGFPASHPGVMAVADEASNPNGGNNLIAPGRDIPTTTPIGRWRFVSGSSYAAAHVSGMVALLIELRPTLTASQIREGIVVTSLYSAGTRTEGFIDACATVTRATGSCPCSCASASTSPPTAARH